jgi:hypothetical protein
MSEDKLFGDLTPFIEELKNGMNLISEANEGVLGYIVISS